MTTIANSFQEDRARWIAQRIGIGGGSLLDIGSGTGEMLKLLQEHGRLQIVASDFSPLSKARLRALGFNVVDIDISSPESIKTLDEFDYISICEVLEHTQDPESSLSLLRGKARRAIYFSVPNTGYYPYRVRLLLGRFPVQWRAHPGEHVRYWTLSDMRWWLQQLGVMEDSTIWPYRGWPIFRRIWPGAFAMGLLVEIRTDVDAKAGGFE
jgi:SAM-dependent methyltransferase